MQPQSEKQLVVSHSLQQNITDAPWDITADKPICFQIHDTTHTQNSSLPCTGSRNLGAADPRLLSSNFQGVIQQSHFPSAHLPAATSAYFPSPSSSVVEASSMDILTIVLWMTRRCCSATCNCRILHSCNINKENKILQKFSPTYQLPLLVESNGRRKMMTIAIKDNLSLFQLPDT